MTINPEYASFKETMAETGCCDLISLGGYSTKIPAIVNLRKIARKSNVLLPTFQSDLSNLLAPLKVEVSSCAKIKLPGPITEE